MIPLKGMFLNCLPSKQPEGFARKVYNGIISKATGSYKNEDGFSQIGTGYINRTPIGQANAKYGDKIIFSILADSSEIGIVDKNGFYTSKINDPKLNFNIDFPIDAEVEYNYKGDLIVAFSDFYNTPKIVNLTDLASYDFDSSNLFPDVAEPTTSFAINETGGSLSSGAYYAAFKYKNNNGDETSATRIIGPVFITDDIISVGYTNYDGCPADTATAKSITFHLEGLDNTYDKLVTVIISKIDGILIAREYKETTIGGPTLDITITGSEVFTDLTLTEVLTPAIKYDKIKHLTQSQGSLIGAWTVEATPVNLQQYVNVLQLGWKSDIITNGSDLLNSDKILHSNKRGFCHNEVYAMYVRFKIKGLGFTKAFHIPGRAPQNIGYVSPTVTIPQPENTLNSLLLGYDTTLMIDKTISDQSRYFQTRDTTKNHTGSSSGGFGDFGFWENNEEFYPDTFDYAYFKNGDGTMQKVRHHRFPSFNKLRQQFYNSRSKYGVSELDVLGLYVKNWSAFTSAVPADVLATIEGYEILYAKRSPGNSTVAGQSLFLLAGNPKGHGNEGIVTTSGGNWTNNESGDTSGDDNNNIQPNQFRMRFHSFDLLLNKPALQPTYILQEFKLRANNLKNHTITTDDDTPSNPNAPGFAYHIDYARPDLPSGELFSSATDPNSYIRKITNFKYVLNNSVVDDMNNLLSEEFINANIDGTVPVSLSLTYNNMDLHDNVALPDALGPLDYEESYLTTMMMFKPDLYISFYSQELVSTGAFFNTFSSDNVYGGDIFIGYYGFVTYANTGFTYYDNMRGVRVVRGVTCESISNIGFRYEDPARAMTAYYPKQKITWTTTILGGVTVTRGTTWILGKDRANNPNEIAYNHDYNAVNDLNAAFPHNPYEVFIAEDPYKIIKSKTFSKEDRRVSWRTFLADDYFEMPKNRGYITNIMGTFDTLFINMEFGLFKTRPIETLKVGDTETTVGSGELFDNPPSEVIYDKDGYCGCQHKHSCLLTKYGYFFIDAERNKIFLVSDTPDEISEQGFREYFIENLETLGDNPYKNEGYTSAWDDENERIIFSKRSGTPFTMSYTPTMKSFTSFHAYNPDVLFNDRQGVYSFKNNKIYRHNDKTKKGIYYDAVVNPFYIVNVFNQGAQYDKLFFNVKWVTESYEPDESQVRNDTFNSIVLWNGYQSSNKLTFTQYDESKSYEANWEEVNLSRRYSEWSFNRFRDLVINYDNLFIDADTNVVPSNYDSSKLPLSPLKFVDKYLLIKLIYDNNFIDGLQNDLYFNDYSVDFQVIK